MHYWMVGIAVMLSPAAALAAGAPPGPIPDEHRLSAAEVQKVLDGVALKRQSEAAPALLPELAEPPARPIEGELGVAIGTGGYREAFGTAVVPLGQDGVAIVSFDQVESNRGRRRRR